MLFLDRPIGPIQGLQIYRDHSDKNQFYYICDRPRLAMNEGQPEFIFIKYARDITDNPNFSDDQKNSLGGGILAFTTELTVDQHQLNLAKMELQQYADGGPVSLSPVMFEEGTVRLTVLSNQNDQGQQEITTTGQLKIFESTWGATKPSLYGSNRATFGIALSQEGATLMEEALKRGVSFVGVIYDLKFLGMRPAYNVKVTAKYERIYHHFEAELSAQGQIKAVTLGADLGFGYQKLEDEGAIKVEVTTFSDEKSVKDEAQEAVTWARQKITEDLFKSSLTPPSFMTRQSSDPLSRLLNSFSGQLGGQVGRITPNPRTPPSNNRPTTPSRPSNPGTTPSNPGTTPTNPGTNPGTTPTNPGTTPSNPGTAPSTPGTSPSAGTARSGSAANPVGGALASRPHTANTQRQADAQRPSQENGSSGSVMPFRVALSLKYMIQDELKTRTFEFNKQAAEKRSAAPQGLFTTMVEDMDLSDKIVEINLDDDLFKRLVADVGVVTDWDKDGIELVNISTEYPGGEDVNSNPSHVDGFTFTKDNNGRHRFQTWLNDAKQMSYRYKADIHFKNDSPWVGKDAVLHGDWQDTRARQLVVNPLDSIGLLNINFAADNTINFAEVSQVVIEARYSDSDNNFETANSFLLTGESKTANWKLRLSDKAKKDFQWRAIYSLADNVETTTDWQTTSETNIIVGEPFQGKRRIRMVPAIKTTDYIEAVVDIEYEGVNGYRQSYQEIFSPDNHRGRTISINTLRQDPGKYTYTITIIRIDGSLYISEPVESESGVIVVDDKDGQIVTLNTQLNIDSNLWNQLYAVELQVKTDEDTYESLLFSASQTAARKLIVGLPADSALQYEWRTISYWRDGKRTESAFTTEQDTNLIATVTAPDA
ncbi:hypothetical protein R50073_07840 [Maricurvus nonylphenolicus]|uniref:hypothetical protein n=1 Tax=Maricurvus nonylphenolicus TaxID=1008307 RepID=UPI0036F3E5CF